MTFSAAPIEGRPTSISTSTSTGRPNHNRTYNVNMDTSTCNADQSNSNSSANANASQFCCLYTKHKTRKKKIWQDGRLVLQSFKGVLHDANPAPGSGDPALDECELTATQRGALMRTSETRLETGHFLIQVEGPWVTPLQTSSSNLPARNKNKAQSKSTSTSTSISTSMQKLLSRKFQKPTAYVPPPPNARPSRLQMALGKRRRPLQPGELERQHYGSQQQQQPGIYNTGAEQGFPAPRTFATEQRTTHGSSHNSRNQQQQCPTTGRQNNPQYEPSPAGPSGSAQHTSMTPRPPVNPYNDCQNDEPTGDVVQNNDERAEAPPETRSDASQNSSPSHLPNHSHDTGYGSPDAFRLGGGGPANDRMNDTSSTANDASDNNFGTPDAFQLGRPIATNPNQPAVAASRKEQQQQQQQQHEHQFASNGFDASAFYGLDDDEEDEEEQEAQETNINAEPLPSAWGNEIQEVPAAAEQDPLGEEPRPTTTSPPTARQGPAKPVSGNQLLALFGAIPTSPNLIQADLSRQEEPEKKKEDSSNPATSGFCLPPCNSQSSSDESEE
jgi:hypothetical protein